MVTRQHEPIVRLVPQPLYPTLGSMTEATQFIESQLPITRTNDIRALLMIYQNTLISQLNMQGQAA